MNYNNPTMKSTLTWLVSITLLALLTGCPKNSTPPDDTQSLDPLPIYETLDISNVVDLAYSDVIAVDIDGDRDIDIVQCGYVKFDTAYTQVYLNNTGTFEMIATPLDTNGDGVGDSVLNGVEYECVLDSGDFDNDGDIDLLATGAAGDFSESTFLFVNEGNNVFSTDTEWVTTNAGPLADFLGTGQGFATFSDINNDNQLEILLSASEDDSNQSTLYLNNGNQLYSVIQNPVDGSSVFANKNNGTHAWGDFDKDGYQDLVINGGQSSGAMHLYKNNQNNTFSKISNPVNANSEFPTLYGGPVSWGDYDGDNDLDILVSAEEGDGASYTAYTYIYENRRDIQIGRFDEVTIMLDTDENGSGDTPYVENVLSEFFLADIDGQLGLDLIALGGNGSPSSHVTKVFLNLSKGVYRELLLPVDNNQDGEGDSAFTQLQYGGAAVADFDNDGDNDLIVNGYDSVSNQHTKLYENISGAVFDDLEVD